MPQMMPLYWTVLLLFTSFSLIITLTIIYFSYPPSLSPSSHTLPHSSNLWNWKW